MGSRGAIGSGTESKPAHSSGQGCPRPLPITQGGAEEASESTPHGGVEPEQLLPALAGADGAEHEHDPRKGETRSQKNKLGAGVPHKGEKPDNSPNPLHSRTQPLPHKAATAHQSPEDNNPNTRPHPGDPPPQWTPASPPNTTKRTPNHGPGGRRRQHRGCPGEIETPRLSLSNNDVNCRS